MNKRAACRGLLSSVFLLLLTAPALAQVDYQVNLRADASLGSCELVVTPGTIVDVHMLLTGPRGATAVNVFAPKPACMGNAIFLGDAWAGNWPTIGGNTQVGITVAFGACMDLPLYLGWIRYFAYDSAGSCCEYRVSAHPFFGDIVAVDCDFVDTPGVPGHKVVMNANETCRCDLPVPVRDTTWGGVKALYR